MASLDAQGKGAPRIWGLPRQSSQENGSVECDNCQANDSSSFVSDQECQSRSPDAMETMCFQAVSPANSQAESVKSCSPEVNRTEGFDCCSLDTEGHTNIPPTFTQAQPTYVRDEVPGTFVGPSSMN
ncbi:sal 4 isoform X1 [Sigmodon hispidus]